MRPEGTASVVRAAIQHGLLSQGPQRLWYMGPMFRYERPQAGRQRQFHQIGLELLGVADERSDVDAIAIAWDLLADLGVRGLQLQINTLGTPEDRRCYREQLVGWLEQRAHELDPDSRHRLTTNPLRILDSKSKATQQLLLGAPQLLGTLGKGSRERFDRVCQLLRALDIPFVLQPRLVRGLDYYTHSTWEFASGALTSAQNAVGGGGRYDGLAESLGGKPAPGVGFGAGIERILLAAEAEGALAEAEAAVDVFVVDVTGGEAGRDLTFELRRHGISADRAFDARSMKAQMKVADRSGARFALLVGPNELAAGAVTLRDLRSDAGQIALARTEVAVEAASRLAGA